MLHVDNAAGLLMIRSVEGNALVVTHFYWYMRYECVYTNILPV